MEKLKIAIILDQDYIPSNGGGYAYHHKLIQEINKYSFDDRLEICFLNFKDGKVDNFNKNLINIPLSTLKNHKWTTKRKALRYLFNFPLINYFQLSNQLSNTINNEINKAVEQLLIENKIDLVYYLTPFSKVYNHPFIMTHWDYGHKSMFAFPEVAMNNTFDNRIFYHNNVLCKAFAIFAESNESKSELYHYDKINHDRIFTIPLFPGKVIEMNVNEEDQKSILDTYSLSKMKYYFYPAQFWSHKNHYGLIKAFAMLIKKSPDLKMVFCGSDKGNLDYIKQLIKLYNLDEFVIITGFVPEEHLFTFYKNAISLVMPTFLGPTNMPLLEAKALNCPVICSNLAGHREQLGNDAYYVDPANFFDIYEKMLLIINSKKNIPPSNINIGSTKITLDAINESFLKLIPYRKTFGMNFKQF